jgi:tetratricopeptide (TPR) repeat protein
LGFCIAITYIIFRLLKIDACSTKITNSKVTALAVIMVGILLPFSIKTITRNKEWKNYLTLFSADIEYLANSAKANQSYAAQLLKEAYDNDLKNPPPQVQQKYLEQAVKYLHRTIEIDSTHKYAWNNLGFVSFMYLNKEEEGIFYMNKSVEIDPEYERAHYNLGHAYKQIKQFDKSIAHLKKASEINPGESNYLSKLADVYLITGEYDQALQTDIKAIQVNPESELPYINLGNIYWMKTDTVKAIQNWEKAFELNPEHINLARNLAGYYSSINHSKADYYKSKIQELTSKPGN